MTLSPSIVWFQHDLRMRDNPALMAAVHRGHPLICLFVWNPEAAGYAKPGSASQWWLHHSLHALAEKLTKAGNTLIVRMGQAPELIAGLIRQLGVTHLYWNQSCEPVALEEEQRILEIPESEKIQANVFHGNTLVDPSSIQTHSHQPYSIFTPFWKRFQTHATIDPPVLTPQHLPPLPAGKVRSDSLSSLQLLPSVDRAQGLRETWSPGEDGALSRMKKFLKDPVKTYETDRNRPDLSRTSHLSPHLHFGEISPRDIWHASSRVMHRQTSAKAKNSLLAFKRQIVWREFSRHLLFHFPRMANQPLRLEYEQFPWQSNPAFVHAWQQGQTGYPLIDAGMRELWHIGWMHNRMRMLVASFLTKHLLIHWEVGAQWFWDTLVDADLANNACGWQWVAGCGADTSPFFRVFNPITQGQKFDPYGAYVRRWVPELAGLSPAWIHAPWEASSEVLEKAGVKLGTTYPLPIVNHPNARERALEAYQQSKRVRGPHIKTPITRHERESIYPWLHD